VFRQSKFFFPFLIVLLVTVLLCAIAFGAVAILPADMFSALQHFLQGKGAANIYEGVFLQSAFTKGFIVCLLLAPYYR